MTAVVLAAGMGNRYGGLKQVDPLGPSGEFIIDYSVYDALQAGFDRVVFLIKRENLELFRETISKRLEGKIKVDFAFQDPDFLPEGCKYPEGRKKPLGTNHALYCCKDVVKEKFIVFNADDFYGADVFRVVKNFLDVSADNAFCMPGFIVRNTLSENGTVSRGICETENGLLTGIVERKEILPDGEDAKYLDGETWVSIPGSTPVSMNFWGFSPAVFDLVEKRLKSFFTDPTKDPLTGESYLTELADDVVRSKDFTLSVLHTDAVWKGVTYREDREAFRIFLRSLVSAGTYPENLWKIPAFMS